MSAQNWDQVSRELCISPWSSAMVLNFRSAMASSFAVTSSESSSKRWTTPRCTLPTSFESSLRMATIVWVWLPLMLSSSSISRSTPAM